MTRTARGVVATVLGLVLAVAAGCTGGGSETSAPSAPGAGGQTTSAASVDTAKLRTLRKKAGIEQCPTVKAAPAPRDDGLPDVSLACLGGGHDVRLSALRGKPTVVNLWASWCGPCREELPIIQRFHEQAGKKVRVIGIDFQDPSPEGALRLADASGVTYPLLADPDGRVRADLGVVGLPQTVFVDPSGRIKATERREITSYDELAGLVRKHLKVTP